MVECGPMRGIYDVTLDDKGRLTIPAALQVLDENKLVLVPRPDRAIAAYPSRVYDRLLVEKWPQIAASGSPALQRMSASVHEATIDAGHRFTIPDVLRSYAGFRDGRRAVLIGLGTFFEIFEFVSYQEYAHTHFTAEGLREELARAGISGVI